MIVHDRMAGIDDPGSVVEDEGPRPDLEVPERAGRRTFTTRYALEVLAAHRGCRRR